MTESSKIKTVVLGIGNILLGDEGIGIHVVKRLKKAGLPSQVMLIDGSTAGFKLITLFERFKDCNFIIIDALGKSIDPDQNSEYPCPCETSQRMRAFKKNSYEHLANDRQKNSDMPEKGDIYLIPLKDFYKTGGSGVLNTSSISFHQTALIDVLNLLKLTSGTEIKGYLIGINIFDPCQDEIPNLPMGMNLSSTIESKIEKIIGIVKKHL